GMENDGTMKNRGSNEECSFCVKRAFGSGQQEEKERTRLVGSKTS
nr:hypothetical protein [Tanacetum cinerariifolium]